MKGRKWLWSTLAAAAFAVGGLVGPAAAQDVAKCQKQIENIGRAFKDQVYKALQFCKDTYRTEVVKALAAAQKAGDPSVFEPTLQVNLEKKAPVCGKKLEKVLGTPNGLPPTLAQTTQAEKTYKKLNDLVVKGKCTNQHLFQLGHLVPGSNPTDGWGDAWIRALLVAELKWAYEQQLSHVPDLGAILSGLIDPDGGGAPDCKGVLEPTVNYCAVLATPPCQSLACTLSSSSQLNVNMCAVSLPAQTLTGVLMQEYCQFPPWTGCDMFVVGAPSRGIDEVDLLIAKACTTNMRSMGFVKGPNSCTINYGPAGGTPATTFTKNSVVSGPEDVAICQSTQVSGGTCSSGTYSIPATPSTACPSCATNGPGPLEVTLSGSVGQGDSVIAGQLQILTTTAASCTEGTATDMNNVPLLFTTGNFSIEVQEADGTLCGGVDSCAGSLSSTLPSAGNFGSLTPNTTGSPGNYVDSSDLSGACVGGGFPGACSALQSLTTTFALCCQ